MPRLSRSGHNVKIFHVDAFASQMFGGNPAAVCLVDDSRDAEWMQRLAREFSVPATAFVRHTPEHRELRWFAPGAELELCGHGTLAAAHVMWESGEVAADEPARFETRNGTLTAVRRDGWIELDFPATPDEPATPPPGLAEALRTIPKYVGRSRFDYVVELEDETAVRALRPDFAGLRSIQTRGVIVTSRAEDGHGDFVSRFFAPSVGIDEDHVTGSAHCCLAPFWSRRSGRTRFDARQLSPRGGAMKVTLEGERVRLAGQAVTVMRGELMSC
jgi:predicted PhzF superfamily epimerase YddE/YHI9